MADLAQLCQQLASGTSLQKQRAWTQLAVMGELWRGCESAVTDLSALPGLAAAYKLLTGSWDREPLVPATGGNSRRIDEQVRAAGRLVAAAALATLARHADEADGQGEFAGAGLLWARRAAEQEPGGPEGPDALPLDARADEVQRVRGAFHRLRPGAAPQRSEVAQAQDAALAFLRNGATPVLSPAASMRVPVLLARRGSGYLAWLRLERLEHGYGTLFQAPNTLLDPVQPDLRRAIERAWEFVQRQRPLPAGQDVRWRLTGVPTDENGAPIPVCGESLQAAAVVGFFLLIEGRQYNPCCAVSATVAEDGTLHGVQGISGDGSPKLHAARALRPLPPVPGHALVIVSPENRLPESEQADWKSQGVKLVEAETVAQVVPLAALPVKDAKPGAGGDVGPKLPGAPLRIALLYRRGTHPDERLASYLEAQLLANGYEVFIDRDLPVGLTWAQEVTEKVQSADGAVPLLSAAAVESEMLAFQVQVAGEAEQQGGKPRLLPVRVNHSGSLPHPLAAVLPPPPHFEWRGQEDNERLAAALLEQLRSTPSVPEPPAVPPAPPTGVVPLDSDYYVVRPTDEEFRAAIARRDSIVRIKGARQMGKTSLLARGMQGARESGRQVVLTDFQGLNAAHLASVDSLVRTLAHWIARELHLPPPPEEMWDPYQGPNRNFRDFMVDHVLRNVSEPVVWCLDEVDRLFGCDFASEFFGLLRSWHNERALNPALPWSRLTVALSYATEAHLFITDLNQSPFNVGTRINLQDFTTAQVADLNSRYGSPLHGDAELERCCQLLGGHPYLTHRGIHAMAARPVSLEEFEREADEEEGIFGDHLRRLLALLARDQDLLAAMREMIHGRPCPDAGSYYRLWSAGVITGDSAASARPRCLLYARYLRRHLR